MAGNIKTGARIIKRAGTEVLAVPTFAACYQRVSHLLCMGVKLGLLTMCILHKYLELGNAASSIVTNFTISNVILLG
jgi:hypothetical protein